jgi:hypothetical protein
MKDCDSRRSRIGGEGISSRDQVQVKEKREQGNARRSVDQSHNNSVELYALHSEEGVYVCRI